MPLTVHRPDHAPDHVHGCPVHPGGTDKASRNRKGEKVSDACLWDEHDAAFKAKHMAKFKAARRT